MSASATLVSAPGGRDTIVTPAYGQAEAGRPMRRQRHTCLGVSAIGTSRPPGAESGHRIGLQGSVSKMVRSGVLGFKPTDVPTDPEHLAAIKRFCQGVPAHIWQPAQLSGRGYDYAVLVDAGLPLSVIASSSGVEHRRDDVASDRLQDVIDDRFDSEGRELTRYVAFLRRPGPAGAVAKLVADESPMTLRIALLMAIQHPHLLDGALVSVRGTACDALTPWLLWSNLKSRARLVLCADKVPDEPTSTLAVSDYVVPIA